MFIPSFFLFSLLLLGSVALANEPSLPPGLPPSLPQSEDDWNDEAMGWQTTVFWEERFGGWRNKQSFSAKRPITEGRLQLSGERAFDTITINLSADLLYDNIAKTHRIKLENGQGWFDLRTANIIFSPLSNMDIRLGRQTLTWGTGDLIFINDLFPKDWNSFLVGRDNTYLKAPSDAIKASFFNENANLDIVYTPRFDADRYIDGSRVSYYNPSLGRITGTDALVTAEKPDQWFEDDELALRLYCNIAAYEVALYGYSGFWKSPGGANPVNGNAIFPRLNVYGASLRGPLLGGIISSEWGYYDSKDDPDGDNPLINNSEQRLLLGYEHELIANITLAVQLYSTHKRNDNSAFDNRHEISTRLTWMAFEQKLTTSLFLRYSTSDKDYYLRPKIHYTINDHWSYELGANIFHGEQAYTFFGQFEHNDNVYAALRYGF